MAATAVRCVSRIEVESKFMPTSLLRPYLDRRLCDDKLEHPPRPIRDGLTVCQDVTQDQVDTYYDMNGKLSSDGIWVRWRRTYTLPRRWGVPVAYKPTDQWEAKIKLGGDFNNSQFEEIVGRKNIVALLQDRYRMALEDLEEMPPTADLFTRRSAFTLHDSTVNKECPNASMFLVVDRVTSFKTVAPVSSEFEGFTHEIGEIELMEELVSATQEDKQRVSRRLRKFLDEFMLRHADLFSTNPKPVGKLSAYFAWKQSQGKRDNA